MFGLNKIFYGIVGIILIALVSVGGYLYVDNKKKEAALALERANNTLLKEADESNQRTIDRIMRERDENEARVNELNRALELTENELRELQAILNRHDLTGLAYARPELMERRFNDGTREVFDRLRNITRP